MQIRIEDEHPIVLHIGSTTFVLEAFGDELIIEKTGSDLLGVKMLKPNEAKLI